MDIIQTARKSNPDDLNLMLAHAWAMTRQVEEGLHIDSLRSDMLMARTIFDAAVAHVDRASIAPTAMAGLESDIGYWTKRAQAFDSQF